MSLEFEWDPKKAKENLSNHNGVSFEEGKWQQQKLESLGIASQFDAVLISETEGVRKPDRAIFDRALDRCGVRSAEAAFIGDNPEADVAGAKAAGLVAIWKYVPYWQMKVEGVVIVRRLTEILPLCLEA